MTDRLTTTGWLFYRRARALAFTCAGRNPLASGRRRMTLRQEWDSVRGLVSARNRPARVVDRDSNGHVLWDTALGRFWAPRGAGSDYVQRLAVEMHANVYDLASSRKGKAGFVVLDCGANVGFFTRFALRSGATLVVAFEPSPDNALCFQKNLAEDIAAGKVILVNKGVWDQETKLSFSTANVNNPGGHHIVEDGAGDMQVAVCSIDATAREHALEHVDYIKMDVEGAERRAIGGARELIRSRRPHICVATEHTADMIANTEAVIDSVRAVDPRYDYVCTEAHPYRSPSRGLVLTPFSVLFQPA